MWPRPDSFGRSIDRISAFLFLLDLMNVGVKNEQGLGAANELAFEVLRVVLKYPHKAKVITTNAEGPANAYKENSQPSSGFKQRKWNELADVFRL
jgi:hypothetical protein